MNLKPLLTIWTRPTATMEYMKNETTTKYAIFILALAALATGGYQAGNTGFFNDLPLAALIPLLITSTFVGGIVSWIIGSALYTWIGKGIFSGTGKFTEMLRVVPATSIPMIWMAPVNYWIIAAYGKLAIEVPPEGSLVFTYLPLTVYFLVNLITIALGIYGVVVSSKGIGLVHGFSAWRGLGVNLIVLAAAFLIIFVILFLGFLIFAVI